MDEEDPHSIRDHVAQVRDRADADGTISISFGDCELCGQPAMRHAQVASPAPDGWTPKSLSEPDADSASEYRKVLKQIRAEDRRAVRWWLSQGLAFGEKSSREAREHISTLSPQAARMTELLELLIKNYRKIDSTYHVLSGMDLESERSSELNRRQ
jgi:hypothetical protein